MARIAPGIPRHITQRGNQRHGTEISLVSPEFRLPPTASHRETKSRSRWRFPALFVRGGVFRSLPLYQTLAPHLDAPRTVL